MLIRVVYSISSCIFQQITVKIMGVHMITRFAVQILTQATATAITGTISVFATNSGAVPFQIHSLYL